MIKKFYLICLVQLAIVFGVNTVLAQSQLGNYRPQALERYYSNDINTFGETIVPLFFLPGFLDQSFYDASDDLVYPGAHFILSSDEEIDLNQKFLSTLQSSVIVTEDGIVREYVDVILLSADISDEREFENSTNNITFVGINDDSIITKVAVNGEEVDIIPSNIVEFSSTVELERGDNVVVVEGELLNQNLFRREYNVTYGKEAPGERNWLLLGSAALGFNDNVSSVPVEEFATEDLGNIFDLSERREDYFYQLGLLFIYSFDEDITWFLGGFSTRFTEADNEKFNLDMLHLGIDWELDEINFNAGLARLVTDTDQSYLIFAPEVAYDFNYTEGDHSGFTAGIGATYRRLPGGLIGSGSNLFGAYNFNYLFEGIRTIKFTFKYGEDNYGTDESLYSYMQLSNNIQWFKTNWQLDLALDIQQRNYSNQLSASLEENKGKRSDLIYVFNSRYTRHITHRFGVYIQGTFTINYSNKSPSDKNVYLVGMDYLY